MDEMFKELEMFNMDMFSLKNKVAIVTGGNKGLGLAYAVALAKAGADIFLPCRSKTNWEEIEALIKKENRRVEFMQVDLANKDMAKKAIDKCFEVYGKIDILVNNAGKIKRIPILDMPVSEYKQVIDVDLVAPFIVSKRVAPKMIEKRSGKIINMCSMMSVYGRNSVSAYASAKGGLKLLTANMTCEWAKYNIQVNGIGPGYIATEQTAPIREGGHPFNDLVMTRTPAGRWGEPDDVGNAALFLASKASDFVNGHVLYVDGGILANFGYVKGENEIS